MTPAKPSFPNLVEGAFAFLERDHRLRRVEESETQLRYESDGLRITIARDRRSGEVTVTFGVPPSTSAPDYTLEDVLFLVSPSAHGRLRPPQVYDETQLSPQLHKLAAEVRDYALPAFDRDPTLFDRLMWLRAARGRDLTRTMCLRRVREEASTAWQNRDLSRLIDLFESIEDWLTDSERRKLEYARRRLND